MMKVILTTYSFIKFSLFFIKNYYMGSEHLELSNKNTWPTFFFPLLCVLELDLPGQDVII